MIDEVLFMRHGRTAFNLARRMQGQIDVPLDIVGQWQADQSAYELAQRYYWAKVAAVARDERLLAQPGPRAARRSDIDEYRQAPAACRRLTVVASDLFRAVQTAHAFADLLGLEVATDERLRERSFGRWEGMTREEIREMDARAFASWRAHTGGELAYGVESRRALGERGAQAVRSLVAAHDGDGTTTLMLVGHGSWIVATIQTLLGMDVDDVSELGAMRNAFWSRMTPRRRDDGSIGWLLEEYNQGPRIAGTADWENGPAELRRPGMPLWKPIV